MRLSSAVLLSALTAATAAAQTFTVTSTADTNTAGTLRWAIHQANAFNGAATINLQAGLGTIAVTAPMPLLTNAAGITVVGNNNAINGQDSFRPFFVYRGPWRCRT